MAETILLVDDEEGIRKVLGISLQDAGYEVLTASSGEEALNVFRTQQPALVLTDIKMPGMDGIELLQRIKQESPDTEVIMLTGHGDLDLAIKSLQCEAADFVTKPISGEALEIALKRAHDRMWLRTRLREYTESLEGLVYQKTQQLLQSERLAAIGQTIATLAHAIKNIIGGLSGGMFVLEKGMQLSNEEYRTQGWEMLKGNVAKIKNLSLGLLSYAKDREPAFQLCDPNDPVREVYNLMLPRAKDAGVKLEIKLAEELGYALLDPEGIHSCLLNLVTNAIEACTDLERMDRTPQVVIQSLAANGWAVEYQIEDNGSGMDVETKRQVFNNFFSTKGSKGTGLGLMITRKVITEHGGTIELTSEKGKGSTFSIRLPKRYDIAASRINQVGSEKGELDVSREPAKTKTF